MAGGGLNTSSQQRLGTRVFIFTWFVILVAMERLVTVDALCTFTGMCLPSLPALELTCDCPKGEAHFASLQLIKIKYQDPNRGPADTVYDPLQKWTMPGVEVVAEENRKSREGRSRLVLRVMNYTRPHHRGYTCLIVGRDNEPKSAIIPLNMVKDCPSTTTSTTTTTTTTTATTTTTESRGPGGLLPVTPKEDITRFAATSGNTKDGFSGVGLYVAVALSCVLLIVIVIVIIGFVRVRGRRKREKLDLEQELDLRETPHLRPNCCHPDNNQSNGKCVISNSPTCKLIGQDHACAVHTSCQPRCRHQTEASFQGKGEDLADLTPLLAPHCPQGCGQRNPPRKPATTSEDEEDVRQGRRRDRLLEHYPSRSRSQDAPCRSPARHHSRSSDELDQEDMSSNKRSRQFHRYSFPRNGVYEDLASEEDGWSSCGGRRSRRQHQQIRVNADVHDQEPVQAAPVTPTRGTSRYLYDDRGRARVSRPDFRRGRNVSAEPAPFTARGQERNDSAACEGWYIYPVTSPSEDDLYAGTASEGEVFLAEGRALPRHDLQVDGEMAARYGDSPACRFAQQPRALQGGRGYPTVRRHGHRSPTSPPPHYDTTPTRHRSPPRSARPLRHNLSHPQLYYLSDGGGRVVGPGVYFLADSDYEDILRPVQPSTRDRLPPTRRVREPRSRRSRSLGSIHDDRRERPAAGPQDRERPAGPQMAAAAPAAAEGIRELSPLPGERGDGVQMNVLSRINPRTHPPPAPTSQLNVPVGPREPSPRDEPAASPWPQHDTTRRKTLAADPSPVPPATTSRVAQTRRERGGSRHRRGPDEGAAQPSDSSPSSCRRHSTSSSTDNDNPRPSTSRGRRRPAAREAEAEINLRAIKPDNETRRKRPVSVKVRNNNDNNNNAAHPPVVCAADVAAESGGGAPALRRGVQRRESGRNVRWEGEEGGSRPRPQLADFGVEVISPPDSSSGHCSHFTESNHSTSAKTPHPC